MKGQKVIETLDKLPNEFSTEELMDKLLFIEKVEQGLKDAENGKTISFKDAQNRMNKKWAR